MFHRPNMTIALLALTLIALMHTALPSHANQDGVERAEMINLQKALKLYRGFERESRHLHLLQANSIIAVQAGWNKGDLAYGTHVDLLKEAAESLILPKIKRLKARLGSNKNLSEDDKQRFGEAVDQMLTVISLSRDIFEALGASDIDRANAIYHEQSLPLFEAIWATNYTLISEAERKFPKR